MKKDVEGSFGQVFQICFPFQRKQIFLFAVAFFTCGNHVSFAAFPASNEWHHMVHGKVFTTHPSAAIIAFTLLNTGVPPVGASQTPGLFLFTADFFFIDPV
jgi:hypothetical protein